MVIKFGLSCWNHEKFDYTKGDAILDGTFGAVAGSAGITGTAILKTAIGSGLKTAATTITKKNFRSVRFNSCKTNCRKKAVEEGKDFFEFLDESVFEDPVSRFDDSIEKTNIEAPMDNSFVNKDPLAE